MKLLKVLAITFIALIIISMAMFAYAYFFTANIQLFLSGVLVAIAAGIALIVTLIISSIVEAD
ncbi:hypothetical protein [Lapidilactobacillus dextrinicus]|uniref:hypothetical protein n=1 Tax=Lapidilactobacillus dextrinicus TaxID=51664 RepID=UPI003F241C13